MRPNPSLDDLPLRPELGVPARVVPLDAGWSDLGAWDALWDVLPRDAQGNAHTGQTLAIDTRDSLLFSETCLVATVGVDNLVVVETPDAILVADKRKTQDVKKIVAELRPRSAPWLSPTARYTVPGVGTTASTTASASRSSASWSSRARR